MMRRLWVALLLWIVGAGSALAEVRVVDPPVRVALVLRDGAEQYGIAGSPR